MLELWNSWSKEKISTSLKSIQECKPATYFYESGSSNPTNHLSSQVEHTVSESITDIDLIRAQILVANGISLKEIGLEKPLEEPRRVSIQSRVTSEIPSMGISI